MNGAVAVPGETADDPVPNVWRAATDNDGLKLMEHIVRVREMGSRTLIRWRDAGLDTRPAHEIVDHTVSVSRSESGADYRHRFEVPDEAADLPRVGVLFRVDPRFDRFVWFGRGPHENYPDRNRSAMLGRWSSHVEPSPYLVPQEFGLRTGTLWLELIDDDRGDRLRLTSLGGDFCWSATRYAPQALFAAGNASDLREDGRLVVCLDAAHRGSGPGHAGPTSSRSTGSDRDDTSWPTGWNWSPRCRGWRGRRRTPRTHRVPHRVAVVSARTVM